MNSLLVLTNGNLASGSEDKTIKIWDMTSRTLIRTLSGHTGSVHSSALLQNGYLASSSKEVIIWNTDTAAVVRTIAITGEISSLVTMLNGNLAGANDGNSIIIWNVDTGNIVRTISSPHSGFPQGLAILNNGNLVSGGNYGDNKIKIWNKDDGTLVSTLTGHSSYVGTFAVLTNGNLVSGSGDNTIKVWNSADGSLIKTITAHTNTVSSLAALQSNYFASSSYDGKVLISS